MKMVYINSRVPVYYRHQHALRSGPHIVTIWASLAWKTICWSCSTKSAQWRRQRRHYAPPTRTQTHTNRQTDRRT